MALPAQAEAPRRTIQWYAGLGCLVFGFFLMLVCNFLLPVIEIISNPAAVLLIIVMAIVPAVVYCFIVWLIDRHEREPLQLLLGAFLWGAVVSTLISGIVNSLVAGVAGNYVAGAISAPLIEESSKGWALLILFFFMRKEFDNVLDGIVYGAIVGMGFAMAENVQYFVDAYNRGGFGALGESFYVRAVLGGFGHAAYTAFTGAGLGWARESRSTLVKLGAPIGGWTVAVLFHFLWNGIATIILGLLTRAVSTQVGLFLVTPFIALMFDGVAMGLILVLAILTARREARIIAEQLREEVDRGVLTTEEFERLSSARKRFGVEWRAFKTWGVAGWSNTAAFHNTATDLAFRKWHQSRGESLKGAQKTTSEEQYRQQLLTLKARQPAHFPVPA